jgi:hypothetical protein
MPHPITTGLGHSPLVKEVTFFLEVVIKIGVKWCPSIPPKNVCLLGTKGGSWEALSPPSLQPFPLVQHKMYITVMFPDHNIYLTNSCHFGAPGLII